MVTCDDTAETALQGVREEASLHPTHPVGALVRDALAAQPALLPIEVLSASSGWVELLVPCELEVAARISDLLERLESDLPVDVRAQVGQAFRELLMNAIEWGGKLDPNQKVRSPISADAACCSTALPTLEQASASRASNTLQSRILRTRSASTSRSAIDEDCGRGDSAF